MEEIEEGGMSGKKWENGVWKRGREGGMEGEGEEDNIVWVVVWEKK